MTGRVAALGVAGWDVDSATVVIGVLTGLTYAVLAAGLVLVYRATRVINFAHGEIGAVGAAVLAKLVLDEHWNFFLALPAVLVLGGVVGAVIELGVVRRLFRAPRAVLLVATIGVAQLLFVVQLVLPAVHQPGRYPSPIERFLQLGDVRLAGEHFMVLAFAPAIIAGLALFLSRTPYGLAIRAAAENGDRAELVGISTKRVSTLVWVIAGVLSTVTAVLVNPLRGTIVGLPSPALGPSLLLRALAAALVGGLTSVPLALIGGIAIGAVEAVMFANLRHPGLVDGALFLLVLVLVLVHARRAAGDEGGWSLTPRVAAIPERLRQVWWVRRLGPITAGAALTSAVLLPLVYTTASRNYLFTRVLLYALVGLSVTVLSGWAGQLSLGQFAFVGLGAMCTASLVDRGMTFPVAVGYAAVAGVLAALAVGFPALRVRGLFLSVTTLAFAIAASNWLFNLDVFTTGGSTPVLPRATILGFLDLDAPRTYYYVCLFVLLVSAAMVSRLRRTGIGRSLIAVRENEHAAASFAIAPATAKLTAFALAGALAAIAGALLAGLEIRIESNAFGPHLSLEVVAMVVIGGLGSVTGAVLGAVYVVGLPALFGGSPTVALLTSGVGLLVLLLYLPGGLIDAVHRVRDALLQLVARRRGVDPPPAAGGVARAPLPARTTRHVEEDPGAGVPALLADDVSVTFGGRRAVDGVTITASRGEVVGLIGANGAGKSTLLNAVSGFVPIASGRIAVGGHDVTGTPPHVRAAFGLGRVFQDARLFGDLTVRETVKVALEAHERSELVPSLLGLPPSRRSERAKAAEAAECIDFLGLGRYADTFVGNLSTGTRRIVELACLMARGSSVLLLDEPTAGVAQRETEAFGPLISRIQDELRATIVLIEHDIPLVMSISHRVYCLAAGTCIAHGVPDDVRTDPAVIAAYLGTDERAIARSGAAAVVGGAP